MKKEQSNQPEPSSSRNRFQTVADLRKGWVEYFKKQGHSHIPSAGLIPRGDPTLLFTTAGMVQFKPYFSATEEPAYKRAVTVQKCFRTTDLEEVGKTARHLTFFEMLGNFSFYNDYFKHEAIRFAWDFSTNHIGFDPEKIHVTVYEDDDEAESIWNKEIGVPMNRISRLGKSDNWWGPAGDQGPCGPCSELYLDRGPEVCTCEDPHSCGPGNDCDRYMEYWNLVFNQFHQDREGNLSPLPQKGIDTGAGLERILTLIHSVDSVYDTDELTRIIEKIASLLPELGEGENHPAYEKGMEAPFRVLADHSRAVTFAIADGILPDNTGRGYVIRRIIRRGLLFARELGVQKPILHHLVPTIIDIYSGFYPELKEHSDSIIKKVKGEEERFLHTLDQGLRIWDEYLQIHKEKKATVFDGTMAFKLYDTFGFPLEMTIELAEKEGLQVDLAGFETEMEKQRQAAASGSTWKDWNFPAGTPADALVPTTFTGYENLEDRSRVVAILSENRIVTELKSPAEAILILESSPFYGESGGQLGDTGTIKTGDGATFLVKDTLKKQGVHLHVGELLNGSLSTGTDVMARIDESRRERLTAHHSATHLLNEQLRRHLGDHVMQTGSLVSPDYLRFDFSHGEKIEPSVLQKIQEGVNDAIGRSEDVKAEVLSIEEAKKTGAVAAFGEKYGEEVRVVSMGKNGDLSLEFCGGCHVTNTGTIQNFLILKESSPGAGNRRIEAVAGDRVLAYFQDESRHISERIQDFNSRVVSLVGDDREAKESLYLTDNLPDDGKIYQTSQKGGQGLGELADLFQNWKEKLIQSEKELIRFEKKRSESKAGELLEQVDELLAGATSIGQVRVLKRVFDSADMGSLRKLGDALKEKVRGLLILFGTKTEKGPVLLFMANKDAVKQGADCGKLIREAAAVIGGGGGGRPDMAQAGGQNPDQLPAALDRAVEILTKTIQ